jgi:hypothetical protein
MSVIERLTRERDEAREEFEGAKRDWQEMREAFGRAVADATRLREALAEIARPKIGGIEANDSDEDWIEYLRKALMRERETAAAALANTSDSWLAERLAQARDEAIEECATVLERAVGPGAWVVCLRALKRRAR